MASQLSSAPQQATRGRVLLLGGTHGNELNGPWLLESWRRQLEPGLASGLALELVIGNPAALQQCRRYLERDLNRSFASQLLDNPGPVPLEVERARELLLSHGPQGQVPCLVALDLHSTTAAMGNSVVLYARRAADLALAAALQHQLGLPIYLHEAEPSQTGHLAECWPCGLAIEVGPVPQGLLQPAIVQRSRLALQAAIEALEQAAAGSLRLPRRLVVHRHLHSLDLPRQGDGSPAALIHPRRLGRDWQPMRAGDPLFLDAEGRTLPYAPSTELEETTVWPVFINEAAYGEKGIALSLTQRETWAVEPEWGQALVELAARLETRPGA